MAHKGPRITIVCVGKVKEAFFRDAIAEYEKRLSKYCKLQIIQVEDEKTPDQCSERETDLILQKEADKLLKAIPEDAYLITLEIEGKEKKSEDFADYISDITIDGVSHIAFCIGGSLGLHPTVCAKSKYALSFSKMTFPHQLMRVILLEQIYRAFRIMNHEPYHK